LLDTKDGCTWRQIPWKDIRLYILEESFCPFHEHVKYHFAHSSVSLKPCLIEKFCVHIYLSSWDKKKLNFVDHCNRKIVLNMTGFEIWLSNR
jgi:hypothetical protein